MLPTCRRGAGVDKGDGGGITCKEDEHEVKHDKVLNENNDALKWG